MLFYFFFFPPLNFSFPLTFFFTHPETTKRLREAAALSSNANTPPWSEQFLWAIYSVTLALSTSFKSGASLFVAAWERESPGAEAGEKFQGWLAATGESGCAGESARSTCVFQPHTGKCRQGKFLALIVRKGPAYATTINSVFPEWNLARRNCQNPGMKYFFLTPDTSCSFHCEKSSHLWFGVLFLLFFWFWGVFLIQLPALMSLKWE